MTTTPTSAGRCLFGQFVWVAPRERRGLGWIHWIFNPAYRGPMSLHLYIFFGPLWVSIRIFYTERTWEMIPNLTNVHIFQTCGEKPGKTCEPVWHRRFDMCDRVDQLPTHTRIHATNHRQTNSISTQTQQTQTMPKSSGGPKCRCGKSLLPQSTACGSLAGTHMYTDKGLDMEPEISNMTTWKSNLL